MKNTTVLPSGYTERFKIDIQKDKKVAIIVNLLSLIIAAFLVIPGLFIQPITALYAGSIATIYAKVGILIVGMIAYIFLHELVHGICMKCFVKTKIKYGYTGLYAYAGCDAYFNKVSYIIIALAPIVVWGIVLLILNFFVTGGWFWVVYLIQIINLSGAAGDIYVSCRFAKLPKDILIHDTGTSMTVYSAE